MLFLKSFTLILNGNKSINSANSHLAINLLQDCIVNNLKSGAR